MASCPKEHPSLSARAQTSRNLSEYFRVSSSADLSFHAYSWRENEHYLRNARIEQWKWQKQRYAFYAFDRVDGYIHKHKFQETINEQRYVKMLRVE